MQPVTIGSDTANIDFAALAIRLRWPEVIPAVAPNGVGGVALIEELSPGVVLLHANDTEEQAGRRCLGSQTELLCSRPRLPPFRPTPNRRPLPVHADDGPEDAMG